MEVCYQLQMRSSGWSVQLSEREFDVGHLLQFVHSFETGWKSGVPDFP